MKTLHLQVKLIAAATVALVFTKVLDAGKIHAYDAPYTLLQDPEGIFYKMVQQTGKNEAAALLHAAKQSYDSSDRPNMSNGHAETADGNLVIFETAL